MRQIVERIFRYKIEPDPRTAKAMSQLRLQTAQAGSAISNVSNNSRKAALATRNLGYVAQNASYQIADFFVMLQGGVGVGRALATQLPQLLAGFSAFGAVLGAVAAIGASVVVMLQQQAKQTKENTELVEKYGIKWEAFNDAQENYLKDATYVNERLLDAAVYAERLAAVDLRAALQPPPVTGWDAVVGLLGQAAAKVKEIVLTRFPIDKFFDEGQLGGDVAGALIKIEEANDAAARSFQETLASLASAKRGTEEFFNLLKQSGEELAALSNNPAYDRFVFAITDVQQAEEQLKRLKEGLKEVLGENPAQWGDVWVERISQLEASAEQARATFERWQQQIVSLTTINPETKALEALTIRSDLEKQINNITAAAREQIILWDEADKAIAAVVEIDRWKPLQDIVLDIGKKFEDSIIQAMKTGKFAVADFVKFALEELAKLYLSKIFTGLFTAFANFLPTFGAGGSPSPGTGLGPKVRSAEIEPPSSAAPFYDYGQSISRVPGGARAVGSAQGNNVIVNVNNYGNDEVTVKQAETSNGLEIDVIIKNTVRNALGDGSFDRVMASSFGARRLGY
jgi:hypothetical protein